LAGGNDLLVVLVKQALDRRMAPEAAAAGTAACGDLLDGGGAVIDLAPDPALAHRMT